MHSECCLKSLLFLFEKLPCRALAFCFRRVTREKSDLVTLFFSKILNVQKYNGQLQVAPRLKPE